MPLPIGEGQTVSQPFVIAWMLQALALQGGERVLEVGTGSGYQTALLCQLTRLAGEGPGVRVFSIERSPALLESAEEHLRLAGCLPHLICGDGGAGWLAGAPYDGIVVSAAAAHVPRALWDQLASEGRMVIPIGRMAGDQTLWQVQKVSGKARRTTIGAVRFVPLISPLLDNPANWAETSWER
jgi:protein-L-isoaspartate(D-aspartate) O-methyltransferase